MRQRLRRSLSVFLALVWGTLLLLAGAASGASGAGAAHAPVNATAASGSQQGGHARQTHSRQELRRTVAAQDATATAPHEVRPPAHPAHPPALLAAAHGAPPVLAGRAAVTPRQERAPPRPAHSPRAPRGPPSTPSS
ncbi:hypothetical protein [Streptomyces iconiensis]|uniref:Secreted protein n=1 Tax=Streptomyces iconiensis TaxID=1384038 RepID=A0ABT6ZST2_9ACTN|nr:hypothetical protein [Streptomyces iconiensis]MDJ1131937.1 hypothetical protein [Streptomyces iconiensis]